MMTHALEMLPAANTANTAERRRLYRQPSANDGASRYQAASQHATPPECRNFDDIYNDVGNR